MSSQDSVSENQAFLSYAREDRVAALRLRHELVAAGVKVWLDEIDLLPGQHWEQAIRSAIRKSGYFIALISSNSVSKRGFVQKELKVALDVLDEVPQSKIYLVPVRLDDCDPADERLGRLHYADLFPSWQAGVAKVLRAIGAPFVIKPASEERRPIEGRGYIRDSIIVEENIEVTAISCQPQGTVAAVATGSGSVFWCDYSPSLKVQIQQPAHIDTVSGVVFIPDSNHLITASLDGSVKKWRLERLEQLRDPILVAEVHSSREAFEYGTWEIGCRAVAINTSKGLIALARGVISYWEGSDVRYVKGYERVDLLSLTNLEITKSVEVMEVVGCGFSSDGRYLVALGEFSDEQIVIVDLETFETVGRMFSGFEYAYHLAMSPVSNLFAVSGHDDHISLHRTARGRQIEVLTTDLKSRNCPNCVTFAPNGRLVAAGYDDGMVFVWQVDKREPLSRLTMGGNDITAIAFNRDGRLVFAGDKSGRLVVLSLET